MNKFKPGDVVQLDPEFKLTGNRRQFLHHLDKVFIVTEINRGCMYLFPHPEDMWPEAGGVSQLRFKLYKEHE